MQIESPLKLIFIYNADSGLRNSVLDSMHKIISPSTYNCNLCDITYGVFMEKSIWKDFRQRTSIEMQFLHKDEFKAQFSSNSKISFEYPIVLKDGNGKFEILINSQKLNELKKPEDLIALIQQRI